MMMRGGLGRFTTRRAKGSWTPRSYEECAWRHRKHAAGKRAGNGETKNKREGGRESEPRRRHVTLAHSYGTAAAAATRLALVRFEALGFGEITDQDLDILIETGDGDGDGRISLADFRGMVTATAPDPPPYSEFEGGAEDRGGED